MSVAPVEVRQVRLHAIEGAIRDGLVSIEKLYAEVVRDRLYEADGFASPQEWAQTRIGPRWIALFPKSERQQIHAEMRSEGQSVRVIAESTGVGVGTVHRDLGTVPDGTPERITGRDGRSMPARVPRPDAPPKANAQVHRVLASLSSFVIGVQQLVDGVDADANASEAEIQTIDEAIQALRRLRRKLTSNQ